MFTLLCNFMDGLITTFFVVYCQLDLVSNHISHSEIFIKSSILDSLTTVFLIIRFCFFFFIFYYIYFCYILENGQIHFFNNFSNDWIWLVEKNKSKVILFITSSLFCCLVFTILFRRQYIKFNVFSISSSVNFVSGFKSHNNNDWIQFL